MEEKNIIYSLRECESNKDFLGYAIMFFVPLLVLEIIGISKTSISGMIFSNIIIWGVYIFLLRILITECRSGTVDKSGIKITFYNFKEWTETYSWEDYEEVKIENIQWGVHEPMRFVMTFCKKKKDIYDFIFSGNIEVLCTEENYALVKEWIPESLKLPKVKF